VALELAVRPVEGLAAAQGREVLAHAGVATEGGGSAASADAVGRHGLPEHRLGVGVGQSVSASIDGVIGEAFGVGLGLGGFLLRRRGWLDWSLVDVRGLGVIVTLSYLIIIVVNANVVPRSPSIFWQFWKLGWAHRLWFVNRGRKVT